GRVAAGPLGERAPCGGAGLDGVGLVAPKEGRPVVLVALGIAAGEGERTGCRRAGGRRVGPGQPVQEVEEVVGIRAGGIEADDEVDRAMLLRETFEALPEEGVAGGRLRELQFGGSGLEVVAEAGGVVAVAGGVDADAEAARRLRSGSVVW